jgi:hypothetical protein
VIHRFEQEPYTGGMAVAKDGEWVRYDAVRDLIAALTAAVETMPTARIISQWDVVSRKAVLALIPSVGDDL